jgi:hypothetical protein
VAVAAAAAVVVAEAVAVAVAEEAVAEAAVAEEEKEKVAEEEKVVKEEEQDTPTAGPHSHAGLLTELAAVGAEAALAAGGWAPPTPVLLKAGDVLLMDSRAIHRGGANLTLAAAAASGGGGDGGTAGGGSGGSRRMLLYVSFQVRGLHSSTFQLNLSRF